MPLRFGIEPKGEYLHAELYGHSDSDDDTEFLSSILDTARTHGLSKLLLDIRQIKGNIPFSLRLKAGELIANEYPKIKIAVIALKQQVWHDKFFENFVVNRGVIAKVTTDIEEALEWLGVQKRNKTTENTSEITHT